MGRSPGVTAQAGLSSCGWVTLSKTLTSLGRYGIVRIGATAPRAPGCGEEDTGQGLE